MDEKKIYLKIKKICMLLIIASITNILVFSISPLLSERIYADSPDYYSLIVVDAVELEKDENNRYFYAISYNYNSMQKRSYDFEDYKLSENKKISNLTDNAFYTYLCFWFLLIFSLFIYVGLVLNISLLNNKLSHKILGLGCITILINLVLLILIFNFILTVNNYSEISLTWIFSESIPFYFIYLPLIISIISFLGSITYTAYVLPFIFKENKLIKENSFEKKEMLTLPIDKEKKEEIELSMVSKEPKSDDFNLLTKNVKQEKIKEEWIKKQRIKHNIEKTQKNDEIKFDEGNNYNKAPNEKLNLPPIQKNISIEQTEEKVTTTDKTIEKKIDPKSLFMEKKEEIKEIKVGPVFKILSEPDEVKIPGKKVNNEKTDSNKSFDQALNSAIEKKKKERKK